VGDPKRFLLRVDRRLYDALERWAADDLRSVNAQIEFLLRESLRRAGRLPEPGEDEGYRSKDEGYRSIRPPS
jgi:hypothetical protein